MKNKVGLLALLSVFLVAPLMAETSYCGRLNSLYSWMKDSLNLSAEQSIRIKGMNDSACIELQRAREVAGEDRELLKSKSKVIYKSLLLNYKAVLTENQMIVLKNHKKNQHDRGREQPKNPEQKALYMSNKLKMELKLSEKQESAVYDLNLRLIDKKRAIDDTANHPSEQDKTASMKIVRKEYTEALKNILNAEQEILWQKMVEERAKSRK